MWGAQAFQPARKVGVQCLPVCLLYNTSGFVLLYLKGHCGAIITLRGYGKSFHWVDLFAPNV